jgi:diguanylate cyclase (GGDEF)-like protein/PAS domain S-box-containing protein
MTAMARESQQAQTETRPSALVSVLERHAHAIVGSVDQSGAPVSLPDSVPLGPEHQVDQRSLLSLVVPGDAKSVTDAFIACLARGVSVTRIHMSSDPDQALLLHYLDLRNDHGIILRMVIPAEEAGDDLDVEPVRATELATSRPRVGFMTKSEIATIQSIDEASTLMLGWEPQDMVGRSSIEFIHPDDHVRAIDNWMSRLASGHGNSVQSVRLRYLCRDSSWLWLETSNDFQVDDDGATIVMTQIIDVSDEMAATEALRHNEKFLRRLTDTVPIGLFEVNADGKVVFVNPVLGALLGDASMDTHEDLSAALSSDPDVLERAILRVMSGSGDCDLGVPLAGVEERSARVTLRGVTDGGVLLGVLGCVVDVTELKTLAETDHLTGLQNRRSIMELLESELVRHDGSVSVIFCDLDGFKRINDRYGHQAGDELLAEVARRLRCALRPGDRIGRLGGDEFLVFCPGLKEPRGAMAVAGRLRASLNEPLDIRGAFVAVKASLGVACGAHGDSADDLISRADSAMYESKQTGATTFAPPEARVRAGVSSGDRT